MTRRQMARFLIPQLDYAAPKDDVFIKAYDLILPSTKIIDSFIHFDCNMYTNELPVAE